MSIVEKTLRPINEYHALEELAKCTKVSHIHAWLKKHQDSYEEIDLYKWVMPQLINMLLSYENGFGK